MDIRVALLDDYQRVARDATDWSAVEEFAEVTATHDHLVGAQLLAILGGQNFGVCLEFSGGLSQACPIDVGVHVRIDGAKGVA